MLQFDCRSLMDTAKATGWDLEAHVERVYEMFRFRDGHPPRLPRPSFGTHAAIQQSLMDCKADLGARAQIDWPGFLRRHQGILRPLAALPRLGRLDDHQIDLVCAVVARLEDFKQTAARTLAFGSRAAHFHFPWLVPVVRSDIEAALRAIDRNERAALQSLLPGRSRKFLFSSPRSRAASYANYLRLGNALMRDVDSKTLLGAISSADYDLHAKVFEWWVVAFGLLGARVDVGAVTHV
jgi:hypothetical protein